MSRTAALVLALVAMYGVVSVHGFAGPLLVSDSASLPRIEVLSLSLCLSLSRASSRPSSPSLARLLGVTVGVSIVCMRFQAARRPAWPSTVAMKLDVAPQVVAAFPTGILLQLHSIKKWARNMGSRDCCLARSLALSPLLPLPCPALAEEQNQCLAVVNAAINELNRNPKSSSEMGKAVECTYILAAGRYERECAFTICSSAACVRFTRTARVYKYDDGRPQKGVISVRFSCKFSKSANPMQIGRFFGGGNDAGQVFAHS